jgi:hypothetical protein
LTHLPTRSECTESSRPRAPPRDERGSRARRPCGACVLLRRSRRLSRAVAARSEVLLGSRKNLRRHPRGRLARRLDRNVPGLPAARVVHLSHLDPGVRRSGSRDRLPAPVGHQLVPRRLDSVRRAHGLDSALSVCTAQAQCDRAMSISADLSQVRVFAGRAHGIHFQTGKSAGTSPSPNLSMYPVARHLGQPASCQKRSHDVARNTSRDRSSSGRRTGFGFRSRRTGGARWKRPHDGHE